MNTTRRRMFWRDVRQAVNETPRMYFSTVTEVADFIQKLLARNEDVPPAKKPAVIVVRNRDKTHRAMSSSLRTKRHTKAHEDARA